MDGTIWQTNEVDKVEESEKTVYLYARCSTPKQRLGRQVTELKRACPEGVIVKEIYSGATMERPKWTHIMKMARKGLVKEIWMDDLDRMGRDREDGAKQYFELMELGVDLFFLKSPHCNTRTYKENMGKVISVKISSADDAAGELVQSIIKSLNRFIEKLAKEQIYKAFDEAAAEREKLSVRTSEGMHVAAMKGKQIGRKAGTKVVTKKEKANKKIIEKRLEEFGGALSQAECIKLCSVTRQTFYRYVKEMREEKQKSEV